MKLYSNRANDLRRVFRKFSLQVSSLERVSFGPYKLSEVPNYTDCKRVEIRYELKHLMGLYYKEKLANVIQAQNGRRLVLDSKRQPLIEEETRESNLIAV
eukprot:TRINITY_DN9028_c0_g1_i16.p4 TRINITY_DN9028_c0_g1~~TRINITY_DN9028_c0_g1_i16.p4  ORF type:complete len:100 (+),score=29.54 TRINITY_DN9028_c0_g1_i16:1020-1319(+)